MFIRNGYKKSKFRNGNHRKFHAGGVSKVVVVVVGRGQIPIAVGFGHKLIAPAHIIHCVRGVP